MSCSRSSAYGIESVFIFNLMFKASSRHPWISTGPKARELSFSSDAPSPPDARSQSTRVRLCIFLEAIELLADVPADSRLTWYMPHSREQ